MNKEYQTVKKQLAELAKPEGLRINRQTKKKKDF